MTIAEYLSLAMPERIRVEEFVEANGVEHTSCFGYDYDAERSTVTFFAYVKNDDGQMVIIRDEAGARPQVTEVTVRVTVPPEFT